MTSVTSHTEKEGPDVKKKKDDKDERLMGYQFIQEPHKTPIDFARDPATGRTGQAAVYGVNKVDLRTGIEKANIPCYFTWKRGKWLSDFVLKDSPLKGVAVKTTGDKDEDKRPSSGWSFCIWVVHGEGMPGNWAYAAYLLPQDVALAGITPRHPMLWNKLLKTGDCQNFTADTHAHWATSPPTGKDLEWYQASWQLLEDGELKQPLVRGTYSGYTPPPDHKPWSSGVPATKPATTVAKAPSLPAGIRFRCACGHWFKESDLPGHSKVCAVIQGGEEQADWAVACDKDCGCEYIAGFPTDNHTLTVKTLDHVSRPKPGYPKTITTKEVKVSDETTEQTEESEPKPETEEPTTPETPAEETPETEAVPV